MTDYWQVNLYDKVYDSPIGCAATIASAGGQSGSCRAIDKTNGIAITDTRTQIDTIRPVALVRARELEALGITMQDLPEGAITLNGATWTIKSYQRVPSPFGEDDGEIRLILTGEV